MLRRVPLNAFEVKACSECGFPISPPGPVLDWARCAVVVDGEHRRLQPREFALLLALGEAGQRGLRYAALAARLWSDADERTQQRMVVLLRTYVLRLRRSIAGSGWAIKTMHASGYALVKAEASAD